MVSGPSCVVRLGFGFSLCTGCLVVCRIASYCRCTVCLTRVLIQALEPASNFELILLADAPLQPADSQGRAPSHHEAVHVGARQGGQGQAGAHAEAGRPSRRGQRLNYFSIENWLVVDACRAGLLEGLSVMRPWCLPAHLPSLCFIVARVLAAGVHLWFSLFSLCCADRQVEERRGGFHLQHAHAAQRERRFASVPADCHLRFVCSLLCPILRSVCVAQRRSPVSMGCVCFDHAVCCSVSAPESYRHSRRRIGSVDPV